MKSFEFRMVCFAVAACAFCAVYLWEPNGPIYLPLEHQWQMGPAEKGVIAMRWYGRTLWAGGAAIAATAVAGIALTASKNAASALTHRRWAYAITAVVTGVLIALMVQIVMVEVRKLS